MNTDRTLQTHSHSDMSSERILVAVAQMTARSSIPDNTRAAVGLVKRASEAGAKMIFLPAATDLYVPPLISVLFVLYLIES